MRKMKMLMLASILSFNTGCSIVVKTMLLKPADKASAWSVNKHKTQVSHFYDYADDSFFYYTEGEGHRLGNYEYYYCDTFSSVSVYFSCYPKPVLSGPPIVAFLPLFLLPYRPNDFDIKIILKTNDDVNMEEIAKHLHFTFNDSASFTTPFKITTSKKEQNSKNRLCLGHTTDKYYNAFFTFQIKGWKLKKIKVSFDDYFNKELKSGYKELALKRSSKLSYWMCVVGAF